MVFIMALLAPLASCTHRSHPKLHLIERQHIIQFRYKYANATEKGK